MSQKKKYGRGSGTPHPADIYAGSRLKHRRYECELSQEALVELIDLTYQQIQKYETGQNRISMSVAWQLAQILNVEPAYFLEGYSDDARKRKPPHPPVPLQWLKLWRDLSPEQHPVAVSLIRSLIKSS